MNNTEVGSLFEHLESIGFVSNGVPDEAKIRKLSIGAIEGLSKFIANLEEPEGASNISSPFSFSASPELSGGRHECTHIECRLKRVSELIRFAVLFSNVVYVRNGFSDFCAEEDHLSRDDPKKFREKIVDEVRVLCALRPALEAGLVKFITPKNNICMYCFAKVNLGAEVAERVHKAHVDLAGAFKSGLRAEVRLSDEGYDIACEGSAPLTEFLGIVSSHKKLPELIAKYPGLADRVHRNGRAPIPRLVWNKLGLYNEFASGISQNVYYHLAVAQVQKTVFLTHNKKHADFLHSVLSTPELVAKSQLAAKHLSASIPFVESTPIEQLIRLRQDEMDAFTLFRSSVLKSANEVRGAGEVFTEQNAVDLNGDVLQPGLAKLEEKVRSVRVDAVRGAAKAAAGFALTLSFGLYLGLLPPEIKAALGALGIWKFSSDVFGKLGDAIDPGKSLRGESLYFLWRLKRLSK